LATHSHVPIKPEDILITLYKSRKTNKILYENKLVSTSGGFMVEEGGHGDRSPVKSTIHPDVLSSSYKHTT